MVKVRVRSKSEGESEYKRGDPSGKKMPSR